MKVSQITKEQINDELVDKILYEGMEYKQQPIDVAIILGSSKAHTDRLPYAVNVYKKGLISKIIVSGGRVIESSGIGEGEFLKEKAIEQGVDKEDIFVEREAMTTWENMQFSREIIIKNGLLKEAMNVAIVTSSFHMRRSLVIAKRIFENDNVKIISLPGEDNSTRRAKWFTNDNGRARAIGEVEKIIDYVCQGRIDDFEIRQLK